jgi:flagellar motor switch protein FliG
MLAEQIDLLGDVSEKRIYEEQKAMALIIRNMEKGGEIVIDRNKKFKVIEENPKVYEPEEVAKGTEQST